MGQGFSFLTPFSKFQRESLSLHPLPFECPDLRKSHRMEHRGPTRLPTTSNLLFTERKGFENIQIIGKVFSFEYLDHFFCLKMCFCFCCQDLNALGSYCIKNKFDGTSEKYKARFVAKDYTQTCGVNYQETCISGKDENC